MGPSVQVIKYTVAAVAKRRHTPTLYFRTRSDLTVQSITIGHTNPQNLSKGGSVYIGHPMVGGSLHRRQSRKSRDPPSPQRFGLEVTVWLWSHTVGLEADETVIEWNSTVKAPCAVVIMPIPKGFIEARPAPFPVVRDVVFCSVLHEPFC